jgi:hypothetical protein
MPVTTKLKIWNDCLAELGQAAITATGEEGVAPAALWDVHDRTVIYCLEQGYWNFATKTASLATEGGTAMYGYIYPYQKPAGWVRTILISANEDYWPPFEQYEDARNQINADISPLYMAYVSTEGVVSGANAFTTWPETFSTYVSCELAKRICRRIGGASDEYDKIERRCKETKEDALSKDAMNEGVRFPPEGRWTMSRRGGRRGDRGRRGSLTG